MAAFACCSPLGSVASRFNPIAYSPTRHPIRSRRRRYALACAASVDDLSAPLAARLEELYSKAVAGSGDGYTTERILVGLVGIPGAGKSSLARSAVMRLGLSKCDVISMDGFHIPRNSLDPEGVARRGAPFTFDDAAFEDCLTAAKRGDIINIPTFDHRVKDPMPGRELGPSVRVVIVEGNYLLHWPRINALLHESWFIDVDLKKAMGRVLKRLIKEIGFGLEEATERVKSNDAANAVLVLNSRNKANFAINCQKATVTQLSPLLPPSPAAAPPSSASVSSTFVSETTNTTTNAPTTAAGSR